MTWAGRSIERMSVDRWPLSILTVAVPHSRRERLATPARRGHTFAMTLHPKPACVVILISLLALAASAQPQWEHLSSKTDPAILPVPSNTDQQTAAVVGDLDGDKVND